MNLKIILFQVLLSLLLFIIMNYFLKKEMKQIDRIILPNIYMILVASFLPWFKDYTFSIIIFYLILDLLYLGMVTKKQILVNKKNYYQGLLLTLFTSIMVYHFFLLKVETAFIDMEVFKNFIWVFIILYFYQKLNIKSHHIETDETVDFDKRFQEYVVIHYAKFKNKYGYLVKNKNQEIEDLLYSFLIYENYLHSETFRFMQTIKNKLFKNNNTYGIMQVKNDHFITDCESIVIVKEKLENKYKHLRKGNQKEYNQKKLIQEKYKETKDYNEIMKILGIIEEFKKEK